MKKYKFSLLALAGLYAGLSSCSKIADHHLNTVQTTTHDIIIDSNTVPLSAAIKTGLNFLQQKNSGAPVSLKNAETVVKNGKPYFHIINANKGFVILSPDSAYVPVLAYDSANQFSFADKDLNPGLKQWFNKHAIEIDFIRSTHNSYTDSIGKQDKLLWKCLNIISAQKNNLAVTATRSKTPVTLMIPAEPDYTVDTGYVIESKAGPLCATQWEQGDPYYQYCPTENGTRTQTGCVPTAMAQIMYFWKTPATFNFSIMPLSVATTPALANTAGYSEVARLMYAIGTTTVTTRAGTSTRFVANYGTANNGGTSADDYYCPEVFSKFGYSSASRTTSIIDQSASNSPKNGTSYAGLLTNELQNNKRPCLVGAYTDKSTDLAAALLIGGIFLMPMPATPVPAGSAHEWVCDGSDVSDYYYGTIEYTYYNGRYIVNSGVSLVSSIGYLHMNWGWGPYLLGGTNNDGWYNCSVNYTLSPDDNHDNFQYFQTVIYNIHP